MGFITRENCCLLKKTKSIIQIKLRTLSGLSLVLISVPLGMATFYSSFEDWLSLVSLVSGPQEKSSQMYTLQFSHLKRKTLIFLDPTSKLLRKKTLRTKMAALGPSNCGQECSIFIQSSCQESIV